MLRSRHVICNDNVGETRTTIVFAGWSNDLEVFERSAQRDMAGNHYVFMLRKLIESGPNLNQVADKLIPLGKREERMMKTLWNAMTVTGLTVGLTYTGFAQNATVALSAGETAPWIPLQPAQVASRPILSARGTYNIPRPDRFRSPL